MNKIQDLVDFTSEAAIAIGDDHQVTAFNKKAEQLFGYAQHEVIGRGCEEVLQAVLPGGEPLCVQNCEVFRCLQCHLPCGVESCQIRRKNGDWVTVSLSTLVTSKLHLETRSAAVVAVIFLHEKVHENDQTLPDRTLQVFTLGCFGLAVAGHNAELEKWKRKQAVTLLKYLITRIGRPVHREQIIDFLWPNVDENRGWDRLKVTMYHLRRELHKIGMGKDVINTVGDTYLLRRDAVRVDAESFENLLAEGWTLQRQHCWDKALRCYNEAEHLYRGDYLEQETYADWCAEERERLRELYLEMLADMAQCFAEQGHYAEAARVCRIALVREPCRESFHRTLMEYLVRLGHPDWAVNQFRSCQKILAKELGVEPMPETQILYHQILNREVKAETGR